MKAFGHTKACAIDAVNALVELDVPTPTPGHRDLLVQVRGISMNSVDVKVREHMSPSGDARVLGYDASGVVIAVGDRVSLFSVGDEVFYAGDFTRPGTNAEFHTVDERIVGRKPVSLDFATAAGMPLTSCIAWEMLFDSMAIREGEGQGQALLVIGGDGGVGSILIQLAKALTKLTVVATASRPESVQWVQKMGADHVINHTESMPEQLKQLGIRPKYVACLTHTDNHFSSMQELIAPHGHLAIIDDLASLDSVPLTLESVTISWEFMFARSMFTSADMDAQHTLLNRVAELLDNGTLQSTVTQNMGAMTLASLTAAHVHQESGQAIGKTVLTVN